MSLHLKCDQCDFLDIVLRANAKDWKCPNCNFYRTSRKPIVKIISDQGNVQIIDFWDEEGTQVVKVQIKPKNAT